MYGFPVRLLSIQNEQTVQDIVISYQIFYYWHAVVNLFSYHLLPTEQKKNLDCVTSTLQSYLLCCGLQDIYIKLYLIQGLLTVHSTNVVTLDQILSTL